MKKERMSIVFILSLVCSLLLAACQSATSPSGDDVLRPINEQPSSPENTDSVITSPQPSEAVTDNKDKEPEAFSETEERSKTEEANKPKESSEVEEPGKPEETGKTKEPGKTEESDKSEKPDKPEGTSKSKEPDKVEEPSKLKETGKPEETRETERLDKVEEDENQEEKSDLETATYNLNGVEFRMIWVEGGTFTMGSDARAKGSGTQVSNQAGEHQVTLSSYLIGETEVTRALWNEVMNGSYREDDLNYPVASVTVPDCRTFVERLNEKAHAAGIIPDDQNFHMLTEAQWEFAAKGGNQSKGYTYAGSNTLSDVGWTSSDGSRVHAVKLKKPNELGIYDMSGNVYEWVADYAAPYSTDAQTNPCNTTPSSDYIKRGGSFYYNDDYRFTCTYRYFYSSTDYTIGLRIGLS